MTGWIIAPLSQTLQASFIKLIHDSKQKSPGLNRAFFGYEREV
jgi:hypothetical protein